MGTTGECKRCIVAGQPKREWTCPCGEGYWDAVQQKFLPGKLVRDKRVRSRAQYEEHLKNCSKCYSKAMMDDLICPTNKGGPPWEDGDYGPNARPHLDRASDNVQQISSAPQTGSQYAGSQRQDANKIGESRQAAYSRQLLPSAGTDDALSFLEQQQPDPNDRHASRPVPGRGASYGSRNISDSNRTYDSSDPRASGPWDTSEMREALDRSVTQSSVFSAATETDRHRPQDTVSRDYRSRGPQSFTAGQSYSSSRPIQPYQPGLPLFPRHEQSNAPADAPTPPSRHQVTSSQRQGSPALRRYSVNTADVLIADRRGSGRENADPASINTRASYGDDNRDSYRFLRRDTNPELRTQILASTSPRRSDLDLDPRGGRPQHSERNPQNVSYGPNAFGKPGINPLESAASAIEYARDPEINVRLDRGGERPLVRPDQTPIGDSRHRDRQQDSRHPQADQQREADSITSILSPLAYSFAQIDYLGLDDCETFISDHPEILRENHDDFLKAAWLACHRGQTSLAKSCVQQGILIKNCASLSSDRIKDYFESLDRRKSSTRKTFLEQFDTLMRRIQDHARERQQGK